MLIGAVDIGSNAMRFLVASAIKYNTEWQFQRVEYLRYPIRLGEEVFTTGAISELKIEKLERMLFAFKEMFEVFEVVSFKVCATSAMRDAANGIYIIERISKKSKVNIEIISGQTEAGLIDRALKQKVGVGLFLHVDVGGGSTEINLIKDGKKLASHSFNIGTVRAIHNKIEPKTWDEMRDWVVSEVRDKKLINPICVGTGGNIKKLHELSGLPSEFSLPYIRLEQIRDQLKSFSIEQRMHQLKLNEDRADVIVPAADIYLNIMQWAGSNEIIAPNIGLIDGIIVELFENINNK
ncbi:MAG: phosphatase [Bacteroidota bacterium]|nr:phosphatase [Bacteroidota bacterium]